MSRSRQGTITGFQHNRRRLIINGTGPNGPHKRIGDILIAKGLLSQWQLDEALREQEVTGISIGEILVEQGIVKKADVEQAIKDQARFLARLNNLRTFLRKTGLKLRNLVIPSAMTVVVAGFDALSIGLLIPLLKGIIGKDFSFVKSTPVLKDILTVLPSEVSHNNTSLFLFLVCLVFSAAVAQQGFRYLVGYLLTRQMQQFMHGLRKLVFERYLGFGKMFFDKTSFGRISTVLLGFTQQVSTQVQNTHRAMISVFTLTLYISVMFFISWELTALLLLIFPFLHFGLKTLVGRVIKRIRGHGALRSQYEQEGV